MKNPYLSLIQVIWTQGQPWRTSIVLYYCAFVMGQVCLSLSPYAIGRTVDVLQHFNPQRLYEVILWLSACVGVVLLFWLFHGPARVSERRIALKIQQRFRINIYEQLTHLPLKWHQDHHSGNVITRINRASVALHRFASEQFLYIETLVKFVASIGFLLWISLPVGLLSLLSCVLAAVTVMLFDRKLIPLYEAQNETDNRVGAVFFDYVSNMTTILTLRLGELTRSNLFQRMIKIWPFFNKEVVLNEVKWFSMGFLLSMLQSLILIAYIIYFLNLKGTILIGTVVMIFRYQWDLSDVFFNFSAYYSELVHMDTDMKGMKTIEQDIIHLAHVQQGEALLKQWHTFTISQLNFHHITDTIDENRTMKTAFTVKRGEKIALIGSSGGGKSTLLNLLCGLYIPNHVKLTVDSVEFDSLEPLQAITTLIPQDPEIFSNTIEFNITMDLPVEPEEIYRVVRLSCFSSVLETLPSGLQTDIREKGLNLSVGQKQRLALARGLFAARFSSLILMDEPTSSVDLPTEKEILSGVIDAYPHAAMMVSLHRLHLLPKFDSIIMLSDGEIVAAGSTETLLHQPGPVRDLWLAYQE